MLRMHCTIEDMINIRICTTHDDDSYSAITAVTWEKIDAGTRLPVAFRLTQNEAQLLMGSLYDCGIRPVTDNKNVGCIEVPE